MNYKRILLISIAILFILSSLSIISAADDGNITDLQSADETAVDDNLQAQPEDNTLNEIQSADENVKIQSPDTGEAHLTMDKTSNVVANAENTTSQEKTTVTPKILFTDKRTWFGSNIFKVKLVDINTNKAISKAKVTLKFSNGKKLTGKTDAKGIFTYSVAFNPGKYKVTVKYNNITRSHKFQIKKVSVKVTAKKISTTYGDKYFQVKVVKKNSKLKIKGAKVTLKVGHGKYVRSFKLKTDANGVAKYNASDLKIGKHNVVVQLSSKQVNAKKVKSSITIKKTYGQIAATNKTLKFNETVNGLYTIKLTNNKTGKNIHDARIEIKISNGIVTKTLQKRTDKYGKVQFDLYDFDIGTYKLTISCKSSAVSAQPVKTVIKITS